MEEYMSLTSSDSSHCFIAYIKYFTMLQSAFIGLKAVSNRSLHQQPEQSIGMSLMETQAQKEMMGAMLRKDSHLMGLTLHLMISTTSTPPISTGILMSSP